MKIHYDARTRTNITKVIERNSCTVHAWANFLDIPYDKAYIELCLAGRMPGKAFQFRGFVLNHKKYDIEYVEFPTTFNNLMLMLSGSKKKMIVEVRRHVFCVKEGTVIDTFYLKPLTRVQGFYILKGEKNETKRD